MISRQGVFGLALTAGLSLTACASMQDRAARNVPTPDDEAYLAEANGLKSTAEENIRTYAQNVTQNVACLERGKDDAFFCLQALKDKGVRAMKNLLDLQDHCDALNETAQQNRSDGYIRIAADICKSAYNSFVEKLNASDKDAAERLRHISSIPLPRLKGKEFGA